jgi:hypothetical protein
MEIIVECIYCEVRASVATMRAVPGRIGFACKDTEACDRREEQLNPDGMYGTD